MSIAELQATDGTMDSKVLVCNHTLHHRDQDGNPLGSWIESTGGYGIRVACRVCDELFGYLPNDLGRSDQELYEAYLEQQRRRSCPGCGEEPFLG